MDKNEIEALCVRCVHAGGCTFPVTGEELITSCDGFENISSTWYASCFEQALPDPSRLHGLCGDCSNRATCIYRDREGGTWHCEEYY